MVLDVQGMRIRQNVRLANQHYDKAERKEFVATWLAEHPAYACPDCGRRVRAHWRKGVRLWDVVRKCPHVCGDRKATPEEISACALVTKQVPMIAAADRSCRDCGRIASKCSC